MSNEFLFNSGSVTAGHPDKLCDQISDAIVDEFLFQDPYANVVSECALSSGVLFLACRYASTARVNIPEIARIKIREMGYPNEVFDVDNCAVMASIHDVSEQEYAEIDPAAMDDTQIDQLTAKQQTTLFGYACDHTPELMPLPIWLAHRFAERLASTEVRKQLPYLLPDGHSQVGIKYIDERPAELHSVTLVASQASIETPDHAQLQRDLIELVIEPVLKVHTIKTSRHAAFFVNPEGLFVGGPAAHSGMTGRKTGVDTYGEFARHSGSALSGKGPMRIDRVASYAARYAAKNIVAAGLAAECEVQLCYSIGEPGPVSVRVRTFGGGRVGDEELCRRLGSFMDLRLGAIVRDFRLQHLSAGGTKFYQQLASYGQMGRTDLNAPWEDTAKAMALKE